MSFTEKYALWFKRLLPSPFSIAIILTLVVVVLASLVSDKSLSTLLFDWQEGLWESNLLAFGFQMMLMLVLGHALALSHFFDTIIQQIVKPIKTTSGAAATVVFFTIIVAFLNWGLGLIFGAILARKIGEQFSINNRPLNYPLIGAAGYAGLMVWHGGLSGSALAKVAEQDHLRRISEITSLPETISYDQTVFSTMNMVAFLLLLVVLPALFFWIGKKQKGQHTKVKVKTIPSETTNHPIGAEHIDESKYLSKTIGFFLVLLAVIIAYNSTGNHLSFITPNFINFSMLALCLLLHKNFSKFLKAIDTAIRGSSGILIQFPLYFGILALMKTSGLIGDISDFFIQVSNEATLPIFTFISAGIVNVFVPSGGGQWAIQGPIILEAATKLGVPLPKMIMALAYGDQLTNMLQPFWALPLLSITGLKAKDILPYTLLLMVAGALIFISVLLVF